MYRKYMCGFVTDIHNYGFEIVDDNRNEAEGKSLDYVMKHYKDEELIGGSSKETEEMFDEKSVELVYREENEYPID